MADSADREYLRDVDRDTPADGATSTTVAPEFAARRDAIRGNAADQPCARLLNRPWSSRPRHDLQRCDAVAGERPLAERRRDGHQGFGSIAPQTNDLAALKNGLLAEINAGQYSGATLGHVQAILSDITTAIASANAAGSSGSVPGVEQALRASHLSIINTVSTDPVLANPAPPNEPTKPRRSPRLPLKRQRTPRRTTIQQRPATRRRPVASRTRRRSPRTSMLR